MRIRRKAWARPELAQCPFNIDQPTEYIGRWAEVFPKKQPLHLELGCGKGVFTACQGKKHPEFNLIAIDIKSDILGVAKRNIEEVYGDEPVDNIRLFAYDIERILEVMNDKDQFDRIFINFCNPWPKKKHKKKRLTYPRQLEHYKTFLKKDGEIWFKTDDDELFEESLDYFKDCGFTFTYLTRDLHNSDFSDNVITEHERMFSEQGIPIKFLIAKLDPTVPLRVFNDVERVDPQHVDVIASSDGKPLELVDAGKIIRPVSEKNKASALGRAMQEHCGLRFYTNDSKLSEIPFYPVPVMELLFHDDQGNYFGYDGENGPIVCVNVASRCCRVAETYADFLELILFHTQWRQLLSLSQHNGRNIPEVTEEERALEPWQEELEKERKLCWKADSLQKMRDCLMKSSGYVIYPDLERAKKDKHFL